MTILITYFILSLAQLSIYFYLKNNIENIKFFSCSDYSGLLQNEVKEIIEVQSHKIIVADTSPKNFEENKYNVLNKSLRHLEFISEFEMYLEDKNYKKFPIEFLQDFQKIKIEAQLNTLNITNHLKSSTSKAS